MQEIQRCWTLETSSQETWQQVVSLPCYGSYLEECTLLRWSPLFMTAIHMVCRTTCSGGGAFATEISSTFIKAWKMVIKVILKKKGRDKMQFVNFYFLTCWLHFLQHCSVNRKYISRMYQYCNRWPWCPAKVKSLYLQLPLRTAP